MQTTWLPPVANVTHRRAHAQHPFFLAPSSTPYALPAPISPTRAETVQDSPFINRPDPS